MPKYTEKSWKIVDAAAATMVDAIQAVMECPNMAERYPNLTDEERVLVYMRMARYADRLVTVLGYAPEAMLWNQEPGQDGDSEIDPTEADGEPIEEVEG